MFKPSKFLLRSASAFILLSSSIVIDANAQGYSTLLPQQCNFINPSTTEVLMFTGASSNASGDGMLSITSIGDISATSATSTEHLDYYDENSNLIGQTGPGGNCSVDVFTYIVPKADLLAFAADGVIEVTVVPRSGVNTGQCSSSIGTAGFCSTGELSYPTVNGPNDAGIESIDGPANCEGTWDVAVTVTNYGINQVNPVTINWSVNSTLQTPFTYSATLDTFGGFSAQSAQVVIGQITLTSGVTADIEAWTSMPNGVIDTIDANDSASRTIDPVPTISSFPYYETFEGGQADWTITGINSSWAYGTPAKTTIQGAASGTKAFVTGGLGAAFHNDDEKSYVNSPCFDMSGFEGVPWVALDVWWNYELGWDGGALQYSTNGGITWETVGQFDDPYNWYTDSTLEGLPGGQNHGWTGRASEGNSGSGGYVNAKHFLDESLIGQRVRFRVAHGSDEATTDDGMAFDDFRIVDYTPANLGPDHHSLCQTPNATLDPEVDASGNIIWSTSATTPTIQVTTTGQYWVEYTDTLIDLSSSDTVEVIQSPPLVINWATYEDTIYIDGLTTLNPQLPLDVDYAWTPGNHTFPYYVVRPQDHGVGTHLFTLHAEDSVRCSDDANVTIEILNETGIGEFADGMVKIYPNPARDVINIELTKVEGNTNVQVLDLNGKIITQKVVRSSDQITTLNIESLQAGAYLVRCINSNEAAIYKLIVE